MKPLSPKRAGRPKKYSQGDQRVMIRIDQPTLKALNDWRRIQPEIPDVSTAIRHHLAVSLGTLK